MLVVDSNNTRVDPNKRRIATLEGHTAGDTRLFMGHELLRTSTNRSRDLCEVDGLFGSKHLRKQGFQDFFCLIQTGFLV